MAEAQDDGVAAKSSFARLTGWFNELSALLKAIVGTVGALTLLISAIFGLTKLFDDGESDPSPGNGEPATAANTSSSPPGTAVTFTAPPVGAEPDLQGAPLSGPPGTKVALTGSGFQPNETVTVRFHTRDVARLTADGQGGFKVNVQVPADWSFTGQFHFVATGRSSIRSADIPFQVT